MLNEHVHKALAQSSFLISPTPPDVYVILESYGGGFDDWTRHWDAEFVKRGDEYPDREFQRQSLELQRMFAELFHNATEFVAQRTPRTCLRSNEYLR
jgi:hypothetical protein